MASVSPREDRDRFLAFAFAAADLLIDLDSSQKVRNVLGASTSVTGKPQEEIVGQDFGALISASDRAMVRRLISRIPADGGRMGMVTVKLARQSGNDPAIILGGCRMPTLDGIFVTLTLAGPIIRPKIETSRDEDTGLLDQKSLIALAQAVSLDETMAQPRHLTLMRMDGLSELQGSLPDSQAQRITDELTAVLRAGSVGGDSAARISGDVFGIVGAGVPQPDRLVAELSDAVRAAGIEQDILKPILSTVDLAPEGLSPGDIERSLVHSVRRFLEPGAPRTGTFSLKQELAAGLASTMTKVANLRKCIARHQINLVYQPIISLHNRKTHHYETLARKPDGSSAYDTITFSEEIGLIAEVDIMIVRMALEQVLQGGGLPIAVNISGKSVQQPGFRDLLVSLLESSPIRRERLIFELTESAEVEQINEVAAFLRWLRQRGHRICLDDFGAGAAAYRYLRSFEVDFVKIDGPFLHAAIEKERDQALLASVVKLCNELKCQTVGEMIETEKQAEVAALLGITYGQGWLFGKPMATIPEEPVVPLRLAKRQGARESWG